MSATTTIDVQDVVSELPEDLVPVAEAVRLLPSSKPGKKIALSTVYRWIGKGQLQGWKRGRWTFVSRSEFKGLMRARDPGRPRPIEAKAELSPAAQARWTESVLDAAGI